MTSLHIPQTIIDDCQCPQHRKPRRIPSAATALLLLPSPAARFLAWLGTTLVAILRGAGRLLTFAAVASAAAAAFYLVCVAAGFCAHLGWMLVR